MEGKEKAFFSFSHSVLPRHRQVQLFEPQDHCPFFFVRKKKKSGKLLQDTPVLPKVVKLGYNNHKR